MRNLRNIVGALILSLLAGGMLVGCSGINGTGSVSPLMFLLPGFIKATPPPAAPQPQVPVVETTGQLA